jgi:ABC-type uncharacterized transport system permease subunit
MYLLAPTLYAVLAIHLWRTRWSVQSSNVKDAKVNAVEHALLLGALISHGFSLYDAIFGASEAATTTMHFGFAIALSFMLWLAIALYWIESFYARLGGLLAVGLPVATIAALLPAVVPEHHILVNADSTVFRLHFLVAMLAYSLFTLAALHALLMAIAEKNLHRGNLSPLLSALPPLLVMERLLFRLIHIAFVLLTLTLISGIFFSEALFGKALTFNHKTVFAITSWLIFAALLLGRHLRGWRGKVALRWTLSGFVALLLAYVGTRFVLEVILGRVT